MRPQGFRVQRLDHVHVFVGDRAAPMPWYARVLGLEKVYDYTVEGDPSGPIALSSDGGETHLALFERLRDQAIASPTIAFRVDGAGFLSFLDRLSDMEIRDVDGTRVTARDVEDHGNTYSVYFCDPDGNRYEITSYDHALVHDGMAAKT